MSNLPQVFNYNDQEVRTVMIDGETWFVAQDVCAILELDNVSRAVNRVDTRDKGITTSNTLGGRQKMTTVNESGLYDLVLESRKPEAKGFRRWITSEVLPSIRKTGAYSTAQPKLERNCIWTPKTQEMVRLNKAA